MSRKPPLISICIPTYKRIQGLKNLFNSISIQSFRDFEVVVTDDSPEDTVRNFCNAYIANFPLYYYKNPTALGTPENWNAGIRKANGTWIKLMHDDDYFATENSLRFFVDATKANSQAEILFGDFTFEDLEKNTKQLISCNWIDILFIKVSPYSMLHRNYFGNPSCVMIKRSVNRFYDNRFKYIVDFAYYIELLKDKVSFSYIPKLLINVGVNEQQVTNYTYMNLDVQMYENHILIQKEGIAILNNVIAFDYFWRIYRRFDIKSKNDIIPFYDGLIHPKIIRLVSLQRIIPRQLLKIGLVSKFFMLCSYFLVRFT